MLHKSKQGAKHSTKRHKYLDISWMHLIEIFSLTSISKHCTPRCPARDAVKLYSFEELTVLSLHGGKYLGFS